MPRAHGVIDSLTPTESWTTGILRSLWIGRDPFLSINDTVEPGVDRPFHPRRYYRGRHNVISTMNDEILASEASYTYALPRFH